MGAVKVLCAATVIVTAVAVTAAHVADMPRSERIALWTGVTRHFGIEPNVALKVPVAVPPANAAPALPAVAGMEIIEPDRFGQFNSNAEIEGHRFPVMVDTGASMVCLTFEVAERLAYRPSPSDFRYQVGTANGQAYFALVVVPELRLGTLVVRDVRAMIAPRGALSHSLLGMSFMTRLASFRTDGGRLVLQQ